MNSFVEICKKMLCNICKKAFTVKCNLRRHFKEVHKLTDDEINDQVPLELVTSNTIECIICKLKVFCRFNQLEAHFREVHNILLQMEELYFDDETLFEEWKADIVNDTYAKYKKGAEKTKPGIVRQYTLHCSMAGDYSSETRVVGMRYFKPKVRMVGGTCPAKISYREKYDGTIHVSYLKTHIGHETFTRETETPALVTPNDLKPVAYVILDDQINESEESYLDNLLCEKGKMENDIIIEDARESEAVGDVAGTEIDTNEGFEESVDDDEPRLIIDTTDGWSLHRLKDKIDVLKKVMNMLETIEDANEAERVDKIMDPYICYLESSIKLIKSDTEEMIDNTDDRQTQQLPLKKNMARWQTFCNNQKNVNTQAMNDIIE